VPLARLTSQTFHIGYCQFPGPTTGSFLCLSFGSLRIWHIQSDPSCTIGVDRTFNLGPAYVTNFVYKNKKVVKKSSRDNPIFLGPVFFHWDASDIIVPEKIRHYITTLVFCNW
jgi:hypothetical protein